MMTLDDAIEHTSEVADGCGECSDDHAQLADWLRELRLARMEIDLLKTLRDGFKADAQKYKAENAKLQERVEWLDGECRKSMGAAHKFFEMVGEYQKENARLRELADAVKEFVEDTHCDDCPCRRDCDDNNRIFCVNDFSYHAFAAMRELGIGVGE